MKLRLVGLLICPECTGTLRLTSFDETNVAEAKDSSSGETMEGLLTCNKCGRAYPIIGGIPRLLPDDLRSSLLKYHGDFFDRYPQARLAALPRGASAPDEFARNKQKTYSSFSFQRIELKPPDVRFAKDWMEHFDRRIKPLTGRDLSGKLGLDAGCGFGRHLYCASSYDAEMVGIDLSEGVQRAFEANWGNPRVHVVQGDIYRMPFRPGSFDFAISFGVLHHLPDPRKGFQSVTRAVREGGDVAIWVYGYKGMRWTYRLSHFRTLRRITNKLPHSFQYAICAVIAALLEVVLWTPSRIFSRFRLTRPLVERLPAQNNARQPFAMKVTAVFDRLGTPITYFHDHDELVDWFKEADFEDVNVFSEDRRGWQAAGKKASVGVRAVRA